MSLHDHFAKGFEAISLPRERTRLHAVTLWRADSSCLTIRSKTFDVSVNDWLELGYLVFFEDPPQADEASFDRFEFPKSMRGPLKGYKLVIREDAVDLKGAEAESGLILRSETNCEIMVVSSAMPFDVTVGAEFIPDEFTPEYDLSKYERVPIE